jgi:hypothetical protein
LGIFGLQFIDSRNSSSFTVLNFLAHINKLFSGVIGTFKVLSNIFGNDTEVFVGLSIDFLLKPLFLFSSNKKTTTNSLVLTYFFI